MEFVKRLSEYVGTGADKFYKATLFRGDALLLGVNCLEPGQTQAPHDHAGQDKFYYVIEGAGHFLVGETWATAGPGEVVWAAAGHVVGFVLIFNFAAGFGYVATGVGAALGRGWATRAARGLAVATLLVFAGLGVHVAGGGAYEPRTVVAMTLRAGFWVVQAWLLGRWLGPDRRAARSR